MAKQYVCDICGKQITDKEKCIVEGHGLIRFRAPDKPARESYAGFDITLKSNSIEDMCKKCMISALIKSSLE